MNPRVKPLRPSAGGAGAPLFQEFLSNEYVAENAREGDYQDHLQHDADTRDITAGLAESTTQQRFHLHLRIDLWVCSAYFLQLSVFKLENANFVCLELTDTGMHRAP